MKIRTIRQALALLCASVLLAPAMAFGLTQVAAVSNDITSATINRDGIMSISGTLSPDSAYDGQVFAVVSINGSDYRPIDQVVSPDAFVVRNNSQSVDYSLEFDLAVVPSSDDQVIMVWRDENAVPLDVDPVLFDEATVFAAASLAVDYELTQCRHDGDLDTIFCSYTGEIPDALVIEWYREHVFEQTPFASRELSLVLDGETVMMTTQPLPQEDGLYMYVLRDDLGRQVYMGSSRVGELVLPGFESQEEIVDAIENSEQRLLMQLVFLGIGFLLLVILSGVLLLGQGKSKYLYAAIIAVLLGALVGGWYYTAYAATYESDDYPQYRYTVGLNPVRETNNYWVSYSALDTYTNTPPTSQHVQITLDGTTWEDLINDNTGQWSHTRQVAITDAQAQTAAIRIVDGCASYYGVSNYDGVTTYGKRTCSPIPLSPSTDAIVGCMDPGAANYNPNALISDACDYRGCTIVGADNYDPDATINDGSCELGGCVDPNADNYNPDASYSDDSCTCAGGECLAVYGCTNPASPNYNANATVDDGSCGYCAWIPSLPHPSTYCTTESYFQTNTCTGESRSVVGTQTAGWVPRLNANEICAGYSMTQTQVCSGTSPAPTQTVVGTSNDSFCVMPDTSFEVSTNLVNWVNCGGQSLRLIRPDQPVYLRSVGTDDIAQYNISQSAGEVSGTASLYDDKTYRVDFSFTTQQKNYQDIVISGQSIAGNIAEQVCDITILNIEFDEE